jgi:hypothetical protein
MSQYSTDTVWVGMDVHQDSITAAILFRINPSPGSSACPVISTPFAACSAA